MFYKTFNPSIHDSLKVASLVYDVDFRTFETLYKNKNTAILDIKKDLEKHQSNSTKVILNDAEEIVGVLKIEHNDLKQHYHLKPFKLILIDILDCLVTCDIKKGDFYVAELAIDSNMRGKGLGTEVLNDLISHAKSNGFKRITLDADFRNEGAKSLYEKLGFNVFNKKRVKIGSFTRGMYNMELKL